MVSRTRATRLPAQRRRVVDVAVPVLVIAACVIDQGLYFAVNSPAGATGGTVESAAAFVNGFAARAVATLNDNRPTTARRAELETLFDDPKVVNKWLATMPLKSPAREESTQ